MPCCCSISSCKNNSRKTLDVVYHCFPKDPAMAKKWRLACKRGDSWSIPKSGRICSDHFLPSDYVRDLVAELLNYVPVKKYLKEDAVPTLNLPGMKIDKNNSPLHKEITNPLTSYTEINHDASLSDNGITNGVDSSEPDIEITNVTSLSLSRFETMKNMDSLHLIDNKINKSTKAIRSTTRIRVKKCDRPKTVKNCDRPQTVKKCGVFKKVKSCDSCLKLRQKLVELHQKSEKSIKVLNCKLANKDLKIFSHIKQERRLKKEIQTLKNIIHSLNKPKTK